MKAAYSLKHIVRLTDRVGIIEHCLGAVPDIGEGYCVDDNARALSVCLKIGGKEKKTAQKLIPVYLGFLIRAGNRKGFHQDLNPDLTWKNDAGTGEGFGRAMVALGDTMLSAVDESQKSSAVSLFDRQTPLISAIKHPRVIAQTIIAIGKRIKFKGEKEKISGFKKELIRLSDKLVKKYRRHSSQSWKWFENNVTYDNDRLPLSLLIAFQATGNRKYLEVAKESLDFLIKLTFDRSKGCFSFVGNKGWCPKNRKPAVFDQQPIEAGSTVEACVKAGEVLRDREYFRFAETALSWYFGKNILGLGMIDKKTGGVYDGLNSGKINQNEGAESILSYVLACQALGKRS